MDGSFKDIWDLRQPGRRDSERHKQRIRQAIKDNLRDLITEESIISSHGGKKVRIPLKYLDMWRFKFGRNRKSKGVGQGDGKPGDIIAQDLPKGQGPQPGDQPGEEIYEDVELEEVIEMMLEDLGLPWLEQKEQQVELETEETVFHDISKKGLPPNVDRRRTILRNLRRNIANNQPGVGGFIPEDLRFRVWENVLEKHSNASVILAMDRSGSMKIGRPSCRERV